MCKLHAFCLMSNGERTSSQKFFIMFVAFKTQNCSLVTPEISRKKCLRVDDSDAPVFVLVIVVIHLVSLNSFRRILKESLTNAVAMFLIKE